MEINTNEFQKPLKNVESWDNIFGVDCPNKLSCHNAGAMMPDGDPCQPCIEIENSKFNKRRGK